jgi:hypothetical protein
MRRLRLLPGLWAFCGLAACAPPHGEIAAAPVDSAAYAGLSCRQLGRAQATAMRDLILSEVVQDGYHAADRTRAFGAPLPLATLFGDSRAGEVARLKGETQATRERLRRDDCLAPPG